MSQPVLGSSWTHRAARRAVRPLLGTAVRPNHITTVRLLTGAAACVLFALGGRGTRRAGGALWLVSAFADRADGELARVGDMRSEIGHRYDYWTDNAVNVGFFAAIGIGLRRSPTLGRFAIPLGFATAAALGSCNAVSERLERREGEGARAWSGAWGFDPDDALYLLAPLAWADLLAPVLCLAAPVTLAVATVTGWRLRRAASRAPA